MYKNLYTGETKVTMSATDGDRCSSTVTEGEEAFPAKQPGKVRVLQASVCEVTDVAQSKVWTAYKVGSHKSGGNMLDDEEHPEQGA